MENRAKIPSDVRRQLRQEAGFGCCVCGHPFFQYHHIIPYAEEQHFRPEDMMALCPNDHDLCTKNAISQTEQRASKKRPKNIIDNLARGRLYVNSNELRIELAGGLAINTPNLITFRDEVTVLKAELGDEGRVLVSAIVQNSDGRVIAELVRNEWFARPDEIWDFECGPSAATVRLAKRKIAFKVNCREDTVKLQGNWYLGGKELSFSPSRARWGRGILMGNVVENCQQYLNLG